MFSVISLQNQYINNLIQSNTQVFLYLKNGNRVRGVFTSQTRNAILIKNGIHLKSKRILSLTSPKTGPGSLGNIEIFL